MDTRKFTGKLSAIAISILLASCGGGGGGYYDNSDNGTGTGNGGATISAVNISSISLLDTNNTLTNTITASGVTAKVKVTDASGKGVSGALVTFAGSGVVFGTSNGAVLTNADGEATISIKPENVTDTGSYLLSATATYNSLTATSPSYNYSLQAANITFTDLIASTTSLESGGSTNITFKTQDASSGESQNNVTVNFSATCGSFEPPTVVSSNQGDVTSTYKAIDANGNLCAGEQTIIATGTTSSVTKSVKVNIASVEANSIVYTSGAINLGIQSSGSASTGQIDFTVYANGKPATNQEVNIELLRGPEDLSFVSLGNRITKTVKSDSTGKVIITVYPGNKPGPVEIKATLKSNTNVVALSKDVKVSTGRVTQNGLSLSISKNSLQNDKDGDTATITAMMVDRVGNPVPDGTVVSFVSEGGSITPSCTSMNGACSVTLTTQNPRPVDNRVTVLAYAEGDKTFIDKDGDNLYSAALDSLPSNIGDFFRDDNEDNQYNSNLGEFIYRRGAAGYVCTASTFSQPNIPLISDQSTCDNNLDAVIRKQIVVSFASDTPTFYGISGINQPMTMITNFTNFSFKVFGNSARTVPMPSGTDVSVIAKDNTDFEPIVQLIDSKNTNGFATKTISVSGAEPYSLAQIKLNDSYYSVGINSNGVGTLADLPSTLVGAPEVVYSNKSCEAEILSGSLTVPSTMNLFLPDSFKDLSEDVFYSVRMKNCAVGDDIKISIAAPNKLTTRTITLK